jgi:hypothetical protein
MLSFFLALFQHLLYLLYFLSVEKSELVFERKLNSFFYQHFVGRSIDRLRSKNWIRRQPFAQNVDTFQTKANVLAANIFDFSLLIIVGYFVV